MPNRRQMRSGEPRMAEAFGVPVKLDVNLSGSSAPFLTIGVHPLTRRQLSVLRGWVGCVTSLLWQSRL